MSKIDDKWVTEDEALSFSIKDAELIVEDSDTEEVVILAVDVDGIDEVIKILEVMKASMKEACDNHVDDESEDDEDEVDGEENDEVEEESEED